jgi:hypothetical protein
MKTWIIVAAVLGAALAATLGTIIYIGGTPQYSLYVLKRAVEDGDRDTFYHHFDVARVVSGSIERAVGGVPAGPRIVSQKATDMLVPAADILIRQRIEERLDDPASAQAMKMKVDSVAYRGKAAIVTLKDPADGSTTVLTLEQMSDRHWKVVDVDLGKINVQFSLAEVRERAEELLAPETPDVTKPKLPVGIPGM